MTRKDYNALAAALRPLVDDNKGATTEWGAGYEDALDATITVVAAVLAIDNPRFDRDRFYKACGL